VSRTGAISPQVPTVVRGGKVHLHIFLMSTLDEGDLLAACLSHLNAVDCLPERKLGVHQNKCGCCVEETHCL